VPYTYAGILLFTSSSPTIGPSASPITLSVPIQSITGKRVLFLRIVAMLLGVKVISFIN
jgi:hypothetical protein